MTNYLWLVIAAGALGILYGLVQTAALMKASTGNDKMREIAAAIQEGASAYLKRQYTTIGMVGIVILIAAYFLIGEWAAIGFVIGAVLSGAAGYAGMLISVRANPPRRRRRACRRVWIWRSVRARLPACSWRAAP